MARQDGNRWARTALLAAVLALLLTVVLSLWINGTRPWGGPYDPIAVGSAAQWFAGVGTVLAIWNASSQFLRQQKAAEAKARDDALAAQRAEALAVNAWATWSSPEDPARRCYVLTVANASKSPVLAWTIFALPGRHWQYYGRVAGNLPAFGVLQPGQRRNVDLEQPTPGVEVHVEESEISSEAGPPSFVVLEFVDAAGINWHQCNGELRQLEPQTLLIPRFVHLRNSALPWAGILDEFAWAGFLEAIGEAQAQGFGLPSELSRLCEQPKVWLGYSDIIKLRDTIAKTTSRKTGRRIRHKYASRQIEREVDVESCFTDVRDSFFTAAGAARSRLLYNHGD